ncbi:MAG: caspase family protein, partial [Cytophagales bacterium]|nr:caspase family protein [Cytophagales bacterium]
MENRLPLLSWLLTFGITLVAGGMAPAQVQGGATAPAATTQKRTLALVIGISDYQGAPDLQFAHVDALAFYRHLRWGAGGRLDSSQVYLLLNEQATGGNIVAALDWLKAESKRGDKVIIYFSGHGDAEKMTNQHSGYLLAHDSPARVYPLGALAVDFLKNYVQTLAGAGIRVTFIADACHSG